MENRRKIVWSIGILLLLTIVCILVRVFDALLIDLLSIAVSVMVFLASLGILVVNGNTYASQKAEDVERRKNTLPASRNVSVKGVFVNGVLNYCRLIFGKEPYILLSIKVYHRITKDEYDSLPSENEDIGSVSWVPHQNSDGYYVELSAEEKVRVDGSIDLSSFSFALHHLKIEKYKP